MIMRELLPTWQQSLPAISLPVHGASTLPAAAQVRWLLVLQGRVWLTGLPTPARGGDVFLAAGESVPVPAGCAPVIEVLADPAAPGTEVRLLWVQGPAAPSTAGRRPGGVAAWVRRALRGGLADLRRRSARALPMPRTVT